MLTAFMSQATLGFFLVLGDSISMGAGASRPQRGFTELLVRNDPTLWPTYAGKDLQTLWAGRVEQLNLAISGSTTRDTLFALRSCIARHAGPITDDAVTVTLTTGGNDLKNAIWAGVVGGSGTPMEAVATTLSATLRDLEAIVKLLQDKKNFPGGVRVFLATVYDPSDGQGQVQTGHGVLHVKGLSNALGQWAKGYAIFAKRYNVNLVDAHAAFLGHGFRSTPHREGPGSGRVQQDSWFADPIHPNDKGHHALREIFWKAMQKE
jgi:lysophospholipase L1-like esterase